MYLLLFVLALGWLSMPTRASWWPHRHPHTVHRMPYLLGDSLTTLRWAKRMRRIYVDQNALLDRQGAVWIMHWPMFRKSWRWMWTGRYRGKGRLRREVRVRVPASWPAKVQLLSTKQVGQLRSRKVGGRRPHRARTHFQLSADLGRVLCMEVKRNHRAWEVSAELWDGLARDRDATGARVGVMTLGNQPGGNDAAFRVLTMARARNFPVALLPRSPKPSAADWRARWAPAGIEWWGPGKP